MSNLVIIPTYNEKENIERMVRKVFTLPVAFELLIVDDGSPDGTAQIVKNLQNELKGIMAEYQNKEEEKVKSLVKIYESMKPQDAAKIFEQLQMSILVEVADHMKEVKLAQVLAKMDAYKAKELTVELANRRRVKENS